MVEYQPLRDKALKENQNVAINVQKYVEIVKNVTTTITVSNTIKLNRND